MLAEVDSGSLGFVRIQFQIYLSCPFDNFVIFEVTVFCRLVDFHRFQTCCCSINISRPSRYSFKIFVLYTYQNYNCSSRIPSFFNFLLSIFILNEVDQIHMQDHLFFIDVIFFVMQGIFQLIELLYVVLPISKGKDPNILAVSSSVIGLISLLIGELGCLHDSSSSFFLKTFLEVLHLLTFIHFLLFKAEGAAEQVS